MPDAMASISRCTSHRIAGEPGVEFFSGYRRVDRHAMAGARRDERAGILEGVNQIHQENNSHIGTLRLEPSES